MYLGRFLIAATLMMGATAAQAGATLYKCTLSNRPSKSFMSKTLEIVYNAKTGEARAVDGMIWSTYHRDMPVNVVVDNPARITFRWEAKDVKGRSRGGSNTVPGVRETVTLLKDTMDVQVRQMPLGYDNSFTGSGRCTAQPYNPRRK
jgi:hypothetical protein